LPATGSVPEVRLQKAIADAGVASRRAAEALIARGRVTVDGVTATLGSRVDPARQRIELDGRPVGGPSTPVHLVLCKPAGVTSTVADRHAERTVLDLVPPTMLAAAGRLYPVGRLDRDSEGLILLTNDGAFAQRVAHPRYGVEREYAVGLAGILAPAQAARLLEGVDLEEGAARLDSIRAATSVETARLLAALGPGTSHAAWYRVVLAQGWKRQVRRMFAAVGVPVVRLARVRIGALRLGDLRAGEVRRLTAAEVRRLRGVAPRP
jgi:23S rRNA pseudouridine2605 synthase